VGAHVRFASRPTGFLFRSYHSTPCSKMKKLSLLLVLFAGACGKKADPTPAAVPAFATSRTVVEPGEPVALTNTSANAASYRWQTDDGQTANVATPSFTFPTAGTHTITLTALNAAGEAATVDHPVTVGTRFFTKLEVVALPGPAFFGGLNLRVDYGPAAAAPATPYSTGYRSNVQPQDLPLSYTQGFINLSTVFTLRDLAVTRDLWTVVVRKIDGPNETTLQTFTQDLTAPSANRDQRGAGWYDLVNANGSHQVKLYYETRIP
jgi:hypothetical protein